MSGYCDATWSTGVGDHKTCVRTSGHPGAHQSMGGVAHFDPAEEWEGMAYRLARLLERECDVRGVLPDDVARTLGAFERLTREIR